MSTLNSCGCCAPTPELEPIENRPGLPALSYRIGVYGSFLQRLLEQIYSVEVPSGPNQGAQSLAALTTRAADDPSIALLDAWAVIADVLSFYQERIANEGYLRTAIERRSILELAREIGYELAPGVASNVLLQFTVDNILGSPANTGVVSIPAGTQVQNIPTAGQPPQTFETSTDFVAYVERNAMQPRLSRPPDLAIFNGQLFLLGTRTHFQAGTYVNLPADQVYLLNPETKVDLSKAHVPAVMLSELYLQGVSTNLQRGDRMVMIGKGSTSTKVESFIVQDVETDSTSNTTRVTLFGMHHNPPTFAPSSFPAADLDAKNVVFNQKNVTDRILDARASGDGLDAFLANNGWDLEQLEALVNNPARPAASDTGAFAMRAKCGFFGNNAVEWKTLPKPSTAQRADAYPRSWDSPNNGKGRLIWTDSQGNPHTDVDVYLERTFPKVLPDSWVVFEAQNAGVQPFKVSGVVEKSVADYAMSGRSTGLKLAIAAQTRGISVGTPAVVSASASQVDMFAIGADGHIYHRWQDAGKNWHGPVNLGGTGLIGSPSAVSWGPNRIDVFAHSNDGHLRHWWTTGNNQWYGPEDRGGGKLAGSPSAVSRQANSLDVLSIGSDGNLYHTHWDNNSWHGPDNWGPGNLKNNPSAVSLGPGGIAVFALGKDGDLYQTVWLPSGFRVGPDAMFLGLDQGLLVDSPSAVLLPFHNSLYVAIRASNGNICLYSDDTVFAWQLGIWAPVLFIQGEFTGSPVAVTDGLVSIQIFATGANGNLYNTRWDYSPFAFQITTAKSLGGNGNLLGSPTAFSPGVASFEVGIVGTSGHWYYTSGDSSTFDTLKDLGNGNLPPFLVRTATAYVQSEQLQLAGFPITDHLLKGSETILLNTLVVGLKKDQPVALSGMRSDAPAVSAAEMHTILKVEHIGGYTNLTFKEKLQYNYQRSTVTINANVTAATNGATTTEVLGDGDGSKANQRFRLKKSPLTFISAPTATGVASTLQVTVNDTTWQEVLTLYGLKPSDQNYTVRLGEDGSATIEFGDPAARLKSGKQNVRAKYRTQIGLAGNVPAGSITTLLSRPPGLRGVNNPVPATDGADPQVIGDARQNAPLTVLTLERMVSLADYENFARAFPGVGKAQAIAVWSGEQQMVYLTVAKSDGTSVSKNSSLYTTLFKAITNLKDPVQGFEIGGFQHLAFNLTVALLIDKVNFDKAKVYTAVTDALLSAFAFSARSFAQAVTEAEIVALLQGVPGVLACSLSKLYFTTDPSGPSQQEPPAFLPSSPARWANGAIQRAQLLLINPAGVTLKEMAP